MPARWPIETIPRSLALNRAASPIEISPAEGVVILAGRQLRTEPRHHVPLSRRYLLR